MDTNSRYYAKIDPETKQIVGWYDRYNYSGDPIDPSVLVPLSDAAWAQHVSGPQPLMAWHAGEIIPYIPPPKPLKFQAETAIQETRVTIYNNYGMLGEPTPAAWVEYLRALLAIANGTDTTSTTLPTAPTN